MDTFNTMTNAPAEISEGDAEGEIRVLYEDIRSTMNVGMVNLIYRRMAMVDGLLAWVWGAIRPALTTGCATRALATLESKTHWPTTPAIPASTFAVLGIDTQDLAAITHMLGDYNRGNGLNLFVLTALAAALNANAPHTKKTAADVDVGRHTPRPLPPIIAMSQMAPATSNLVRDLSTPIAPPGKPMIPSLFRHLARWPGYLAVVAPTIIHLAKSGELSQLSGAIQQKVSGVAADFSQDIAFPHGVAPPDAATQKYWLDQLHAYTSKPIPEMFVIGHVLRRALPEPQNAQG